MKHKIKILKKDGKTYDVLVNLPFYIYCAEDDYEAVTAFFLNSGTSVLKSKIDYSEDANEYSNQFSIFSFKRDKPLEESYYLDAKNNQTIYKEIFESFKTDIFNFLLTS